MRIALIDYRAGNLTSVRKALAAVGAEVYTPAGARRSRDAPTASSCQAWATSKRRPCWMRHGARPSCAHVRSGRPLLGICLGLQWLFEGSTEAPGLAGLGLLPGMCRRLGPGWGDAVVSADA